jgi:bifunctional UDP-N-acetylglucosamine pyrophosphorylase/glucosamine-1-phosphate N-acetyltransferase
MQAIILAAGEGTRMHPLTYTRPKVMLSVANRPTLEHLIVELKKAGVNNVVLVVGYRDNTIRAYFEDGKEWDIEIKYVSQRKQLGTADALKSAAHLLQDRFLMINGDAILQKRDLEPILQAKGMVLGVKEVENPEDFGVVETEAGKVVRILEKPEKPPTNLINAGVYRFTEEIFEFIDATPISRRGEYEITDTIQMAIDSGIAFKAMNITRWIDMGYPWDLLDANKALLNDLPGSDIQGKIEDGATIKGEITLSENSIIRSGSYIQGPVIIGRNCEIGPNCYIRPHTAIGDGCHIGAGVEIKNSIIMAGTKVPHLSYVGDSVIGENCNLGAGTKIANLRHDGGDVHATVRDANISTRRRKFGAVIGDNTKTGINVTINTGTMIGNYVLIAPGAVVEGNIQSFTKVF